MNAYAAATEGTADPLSNSRRRRLERCVRRARGSARRLLRAQVLLSLDDGLNPSEVSDRLRVAEPQIRAISDSDRRVRARRARMRQGLTGVPSRIRAAIERDSVLVSGNSRMSVLLDLIVVGSLAALPMIVVVSSLVHGRMVMGGNDSGWQIQQGVQFDIFPFSPPTPHFLFPLLVRLAYLAIAQLSLSVAVGLVLLGTRALAGMAVYLVCRNAFDDGGPALGRVGAVFASITVLLVESPRVLVEGPRLGRPDAFLPLQTLFNPTALVALPFSILALALIVKVTDRIRAGRLLWKLALPMLVVMVLATLAKPNLAQGLLPILPFWVFLTTDGGYRLRAVVTAKVVAVVAIPIGLVVVWQLWFLGQPGAKFAHGGASHIVLNPLETVRIWGLKNPLAWLALLVPLLGVVAGGSAWLRRPKVILLLMVLAMAMAQALLLAESGARAGDGNLGWATQIAYVLLSVEAIREVYAWVVGRPWGETVRSPRFHFAAVVVTLSLLSGIYVVYDSGIRTPPCLRGEVQVTHYDSAVQGGTYVATECA